MTSNRSIDHLKNTISRATGRQAGPVDCRKKTLRICRFHHINAPSTLLKGCTRGAFRVFTSPKSHDGMILAVTQALTHPTQAQDEFSRQSIG